jgi:hypothetical protein
MKHRANRIEAEGRPESLLKSIGPVYNAEASAVGVREALIVIGLAFSTVGMMRLLLMILHTGGQLW